MITLLRNKKFLSFFFVWVIVGAIGCYVRLWPLRHHTSFESSEKAMLFVVNQIKSMVINDIDRKHPNLPPAQKDKMVQRSLNSILRTRGEKVQTALAKVSKAVHTAEGGQKYPYLLASDSYLYYSLTLNIVETGKISDTFKGSKYLNKLMLAPEGHWEPLNLHPYIGYIIYRTLLLFDKDTAVVYAISFTPLVIAVLTLIPFLMIVSMMNCNPAVSLIGATLFTLSPTYLKRSTYGWYDNDPYIILFPMILLAILFWWIRQRTSTRKNIMIGLACAAIMTLFSLFWHGWMFFLSIIVGCGILMVILNHFFLKDKEHTLPHLKLFSLLFFGTFFGIGLIFGPNEFFILFKEGWIALKNFIQPSFSIWPDMYLGVGELKRTPFPMVIELSGGYFYVLTGILGCIVAVTRLVKKSENARPLATLILTFFFFASLIMALGALRFVLLFLIPISIFFTEAIQFIFEQIRRVVLLGVKQKYVDHVITKFLCFILMILIVFPYIKFSIKNMPYLLNKIFNTAWEEPLIKIRKETPENSIINTWWPPGHFIKAVARRRVTFDGASINYPQGYWFANILLSTNEEEAMGMLRMLNTSANQATDYLYESGMKHSKAVSLIRKIVIKSKLEAREYLKTQSSLSNQQIEHLLSLTHRRPPPSYLFLFHEMIQKNIEYKFVGGWNFKKVEEIRSDPQKMKTIPKQNSNEFIKFLWDLVGGAYKSSEILGQTSQQGSIINFESGVKIDLRDMSTQVTSKRYGTGKPFSIFYLSNKTVVEHVQPDADLTFSILLVKESTGFKCLLMDRPLARSLLMQLYFFEGHSFKYLKPFTQSSDLTRRTQIYVYEVDWDQFIADLNTSKNSQ